MKKNTTIKESLCRLASRLAAWVHFVIEKKGEHFEKCVWYPGPCQTEFPY